MSMMKELNRLKTQLEEGVIRDQWDYGAEEMRLELLEMADLLFEVADALEEEITELMVRRGFGLEGKD